MKRIVAITFFVVMLFSGCRQNDVGNEETASSTNTGIVVEETTHNAAFDYRSLLLSFDYGDEVTYVIGHKNPDADSVGSAMAYAYLLNEIGIPAEAVISGDINLETEFTLNKFGITPPPVVSNAEGKQFILVDHSTYAQAIDGMEDARIIGIVDHHGIGDVFASERINVRSAPVGAAATLVYLTYQECEVSIPKDMARVMLMSILSDTRNLSSNVTAADSEAFEALKEIAEIEDIDALYQGMAQAGASYGEMTNDEIYFSDYKEYEAGGVKFSIGDVNAYGEESVKEMASRMYEVMEALNDSSDSFLRFAKINNKKEDTSENKMYMVAYGKDAEDLLNQIYGNYDGSRFFVFKEYLSRKSEIVPALSTALETK